MPYFKWYGIEITGTTKRGAMFARSNKHLDELLFKRQIALLNCKPRRWWFKKPIRLYDKIQFFRQLSILIEAGVLLPEALALVAEQISNSTLQEVICTISDEVYAGVALSKAMERYSKFFSQIMIQLIKTGEESGKLAQALDTLCIHVEATQDFYTRLRSALLLPIITLIFFLVIMTLIFAVIIPQFADVFLSAQQELPRLTRVMLRISDFVRSQYMVLLLGTIAIISWLFWQFSKSSSRVLADKLLLHIPFIGAIFKKRFIVYFMRSIALLLEGGMQLVPALIVIRESIQNTVFKHYVAILENDISSGSSLSNAMAHHPDQFFSQEIIAMVEIGQESGKLASILQKVSDTYYQRLIYQLSVATVLIQPVLMITLGLFIALLIFAVYVPIFSLSSAF